MAVLGDQQTRAHSLDIDLIPGGHRRPRARSPIRVSPGNIDITAGPLTNEINVLKEEIGLILLYNCRD